mmetsp:Transcript_35546/g.104076  ORF Transcript_35546/g.104076 Transcript_35546/m.104076 type:complete len:82 (+) Transcript_35546:278-523(+)
MPLSRTRWLAAVSVVIQGKLHHCMGPLLTEDGQQPNFAQIYTYDPAMADSEKEVNLRAWHTSTCRIVPAKRSRIGCVSCCK